MTVMVVDDSRIQRNIIKNCLKEKFGDNLNIVEAPDGLVAQKMIGESIPDLLLVDWNMPSLNGLNLVKTLRNATKTAGLPIIMITSESAKYNVIEAVKSGVNDYLVKPVQPRNLLAKIERLNLEA